MALDKTHWRAIEADSFHIRANANSICANFLSKIRTLYRESKYHKDWFSEVDISDESSVTEDDISQVYEILEDHFPDLKTDREEITKACTYLQSLYESPYRVGGPMWTYNNRVPLEINGMTRGFIEHVLIDKEDEDK